jgi:hypothetical protein
MNNKTMLMVAAGVVLAFGFYRSKSSPASTATANDSWRQWGAPTNGNGVTALGGVGADVINTLPRINQNASMPQMPSVSAVPVASVNRMTTPERVAPSPAQLRLVSSVKSPVTTVKTPPPVAVEPLSYSYSWGDRIGDR